MKCRTCSPINKVGEQQTQETNMKTKTTKTKKKVELTDKLWDTLTKTQKQKFQKMYKDAEQDTKTFFDDEWHEGRGWGEMTALEAVFGKHNLIKKI